VSPVATFRFLAGRSTELSTTSALDIGHKGRFISLFVLEDKVDFTVYFLMMECKTATQLPPIKETTEARVAIA
jgi:hypothetical protein